MSIAPNIRTVVRSLGTKLESVVEESRNEGLSPSSFRELLAGLKDAFAEAGREVLGALLETCDEQGEAIVRADRVLRFKQVVEKEWLTPFGLISVPRRYFQADRGGKGVAVLDEITGMTDRFMTPDLEEAAAAHVATAPPREAARLLEMTLTQAPSITALQRLSARVGDFVDENREAIAEQVAEAAPLEQGDVLAVSWDGVITPLREPAPKQGRPAERPGKREGTQPTAWKEVGIASLSIYRDGEEGPERVDQRSMARMPEKKMATLMSDLRSAVASLRFTRSFREVAVICDGKRSIWLDADAMPELQGAIQIVDFFHVAEHLTRAAEAIFGKKSRAGSRWFQRWRTSLRDEPHGLHGLLRSLAYHGKKMRKGERRDTVFRFRAFLLRNRHRMTYHAFRERGLPIGSGPVEAACKTIVGQRLKRSGMRWSRTGGQQILGPRTYFVDDRWSEMWQAYEALRMAA